MGMFSKARACRIRCVSTRNVSMICMWHWFRLEKMGGVLDEVLNRLAKLLEDLNRLQNQIKSAMAYPGNGRYSGGGYFRCHDRFLAAHIC